MKKANRILEGVADALADREAVDWAAVERSLGRSGGTSSPGNLRRLEAFTSSMPSLGRATGTFRLPTEKPLPAWAWVLAVLSLAIVVLGLLGVAFTPADSLPVPIGFVVGIAGAFAAAGAWLLVGSAREPRAGWLGAAYLAVASAYSLRGIARLLHTFGVSLALPVRALIYVEVAIPLFFWLFVRHFPRIVRLGASDRWIRLGIGVSAASAVVCLVGNGVAIGAGPGAAGPWNWLGRNSPAYWAILLSLTLLAMATAAARTRSAPREERRRAGLFALSLLLGSTPTIVIVLGDEAFGHRLLEDPATALPLAAIAFGFLLAVPLSTAWAVLTHNVLPVRLVLRSAARYTLARATLSALNVLSFLGLASYAYLHRRESVAELLTGRQGMWLVGASALSFVLLAARGPLLRFLDLVFLRSNVDLRTALIAASARMQAAPTSDEVFDVLLREIDRTIGSARSAVLVRAGDGPFVARHPGVPPLPVGSGLPYLAAEGTTPLVVDPGEAKSYFRWLAEADRQWVVDSGVAGLLPLSHAGLLVALVAFGRRPSEQGWSEEDRLFLGSLGSAASLALEGRALLPVAEADGASEDLARECVKCGRIQGSGDGACDCKAETRPASLPPVLHGKFRLEARLGRGGMGVVYRAEDVTLERTVALKTLPRVSAVLSLRLRQEARSMAALSHPHLALIYGAETWRGALVLVIEYLPGGTLADRLSQPWSVSDVLDLGIVLGSALAAVHAGGFLHRDVKPSNIGFGSDGVAKLLDFGLARLIEQVEVRPGHSEGASGSRQGGATDLTSTSRMVGTPLYLPPEAWLGESASPRFDIWALALVLYELLAGQNPLRAPGGLTSSVAQPIPDLRTLRADCPEPLARFFRDALALEPSRRETQAEGFLARLKQLRGVA